MILLRHGLGSLPSMPLNPLDCFEDHFNIMFVLFYEQTLNGDLLRSSLQKLLVDYPLLTGRLGKGSNGKPVIKMNDAGLPFEETTDNTTLADWKTPHRDRVARFGTRINPQLPFRSLQPLARVRLTHLKGGGSVLCTSYAHLLADGRGLCDFLRNWATVAKGNSPVVPVWNRLELQASLQKNSLALATGLRQSLDLKTHTLPAKSFLGFDQLSWKSLGWLYANIVAHLPFMTGLTLEMSATQLAQLKEQANAQQTERLSLHEILSTWLWKLFQKELNVKWNQNQITRLFMVADMRSRLPELAGKNVFANVVAHVVEALSTRELHEGSFYSIATRVRAAVRGLPPERMSQQMQWLQDRVEQKTMTRVFASHNPFNPDLFISNCLSIPFYDVNFGTGRPYCFTMPTEMAPRIVNIFPTASGEGCSLHINVTKKMARQLLKAFSQPLKSDTPKC